MSTVDEVFPRLHAFRRTELAKRLGVSERTLDRWAADGLGPPGRFKVGATVLYDADPAERWLRQRAGAEAA